VTAAGPIFAGLCATLAGIGLQRFAYALLLPAMVRDGWLSAADAGTLGAVNFAGYLAGAALAPAIGRRLGLRTALRGAMLTAVLCFALCGWRGGFLWFVPWRLFAGISGGVLMVLIGPAVQAVVPPDKRGLAAGLTVAGIGLGIVVGALLVPAMLPAGVAAIWLALAGLTALLTLLSWRCWPDVAAPARVAAVKLRGPTLKLVAAYTLGGVSATPYMGWWPDFIARGLGRGTEAGAAFWVLYGVAVIIGTALIGRLIHALGARRGLQIVMLMQVVALALPLVSVATPALVLATALAGSASLTQVALMLIRAGELAGARAPTVWRISTIGWAAAQTGTGFVLAWLYAATGSHLPLFAVGLAAAVAAVLVRP
jgi:predicted MFS family arabinose efflux permease